MHSHMNVDLCKVFQEFALNVVYVMPGLVSLIAKLSLECCGMRHHELFTVPPENNASYCFACRSNASDLLVKKIILFCCFCALEVHLSYVSFITYTTTRVG